MPTSLVVTAYFPFTLIKAYFWNVCIILLRGKIFPYKSIFGNLNW